MEVYENLENMLAVKNPIKRVTILNSNGISMFHRSFVKGEDFDEQLFSGFTSAMLSFIKEMGNELNSLSMKGMDLYFQQSNDYIMVLGVNSEFTDQPSIQQVFTEIGELPQVGLMVSKFTNGMLEVPAGLESGIISILSGITSETIETSVTGVSPENSQVQQLINQYLDGSLNAKHAAVELIGQNLEQDEADKKLEATHMISDLINSSSIEKGTRNKLDELLKEMKKSSTKAAAKVNKALF